MSRLWLNSDFGPVETVNESIIIYHVVLSGDTCRMCWSPDLKSLTLKKSICCDISSQKYCLIPALLGAVDSFQEITGHEW